MEPAPELSPFVAGAFAAIMVLSTAVAMKVGRHLRQFGGKVRADGFRTPDLFVALFLLFWFGGTATYSFLFAGGREVSTSDLIFSAVLFGALVIGLGLFMQLRGIRMQEYFGLTEVVWWKVVPLALALLVGLYPLCIYASAISRLLLGDGATEQTMVQFFQQSAKNSDVWAVTGVVVFGGILAPIIEEFIFRGYLHGVLKKFCGGVWGAMIVSAVFAMIHTNLASLLPIFVLALILTAAYELTGSLLVNIALHAMFNLANLAMLYFADLPPPP